MNAVSAISGDQKTALLKGIRTFSQMFWGPDMAMCQDMFERDLFREIEPLIPLLDNRLPNVIEEMNKWIHGFPDAEALFDELESSYVSLYISNQKGRVVPLYQSCYEYENAPMMGPPASMMKERLAAVGLSMGSHINEPPDHLAVELEYLYFLLSKWWDDNHTASIAKAVSFASNIMLPWVYKLQKRLKLMEESLFYSLLISLNIAVLEFIDISTTSKE